MMTIPRAMQSKIATTRRKMTIALKVPFESELFKTFVPLPLPVLSESSVTAVYVDGFGFSVIFNSSASSPLEMHSRLKP